MLPAFVGLLSVVLLLAGALCLVEYALYTPEQKARAPWLSRLYLGAIGLVIALALGGLLAAVTGTRVQGTIFGLVAVVGALPALVQYRLHRELGLENGPLYDRLSENWI
ncbi:sodium:proton antiporter [Halosolutus amylolyticus]|uniref:Sodium:proton antiporter n=1 Tax=Halosolutus amylolyticus TaxID=2932267 RepID=A0ABD5PP59_9EURY|nr:sodium:proton antiporter [Halosolutus amylolyticus]